MLAHQTAPGVVKLRPRLLLPTKGSLQKWLNHLHTTLWKSIPQTNWASDGKLWTREFVDLDTLRRTGNERILLALFPHEPACCFEGWRDALLTLEQNVWRLHSIDPHQG